MAAGASNETAARTPKANGDGNSNGHGDSNGKGSVLEPNGNLPVANGNPPPPSSSSAAKALSLPEMIAKYGDSSNTCWTEEQYRIWRHKPTGAIVGYVPSTDKFCIVWGNPLCEPGDVGQVVRAWNEWCYGKLAQEDADVESRGIIAGRPQLGADDEPAPPFKPLWCVVGEAVERVLADELDWCVLACAAEDVLDPVQAHPEESRDLRQNMHRAERAGIQVVHDDGVPSEEVRKEADRGLEEWKENRKGTQIHTTPLAPWRDLEHRRYFFARDGDDKMCGVLVLAKIARGWVIKYCIPFPGSPKGTSEALVMEVLHVLQQEGARYVTFGVGAAKKVQPVAHLGGWKVEWLSKTYNGLNKTFGLGKKTEYRTKYGAREEPVYMCYDGKLGLEGVQAIMNILKKPE